MIKKNKKLIILSSIIILLPALAGIIMWDMLPQRIATHWGASGEADGFSGKAFTVFGLPMIMLALHFLCVFVTAKDPENKKQSNKVFSMLYWIFPIISLILNGLCNCITKGSQY